MFQFLLISAVGSILAIYSRFGGEYANSIRWVRQGGYLEMYNTLVNSREYLSNRTKLILVVTILSSYTASVADVGAVYFIRPSLRLTNPSFQLVETTQFVSFRRQKSFVGWNTYIHNGDNVTHAMESMFNDTNRIPNIINRRIYIPRTSKFRVGCDKINFSMEAYTNGKYLINQGGCANITFGTYFPFSELRNKSTFEIMPNGRGSLKISSTPDDDLLEPMSSLYLYYGNITCGLEDSDDVNYVSNINGLTSQPRTWTTRCAFPTGELAAVSLTSIKFSVGKVQDFHRVTSSLFNEDVELVHAMESSITKDSDRTFLFSEFKYGDTTFDVLVCMLAKSGETDLMVICSYNSVSAIITSPQNFSPIISAARKGAPFEGPPVEMDASSDSNYTSTTVMTISHIPVVTNTTTQQLSIPGAKNASLVSALYLASLGQNMYLDWNTSKLYVIYDTIDIERGLEMPLWLGIVVLVAVILCAGFCSLTQYFLNPIFTGSLYEVMSIQMAPKSNSFVAMVGWSKGHSIDCDRFYTTPNDN
ncbi:hypothetical protein BGX20_001806, partial [Mortierella sp. AD010]